jgi:mannose/cellobiose epimerase-like protein (N-acyl-D-glucosamine 2-epimerase family)
MSARLFLTVTAALIVCSPTAAVVGQAVAEPGDPPSVELASTASTADARPVPEVLAGDTWLRHLREDLLPYWELPEALGTPWGNFPSFRDPQGRLDPGRGTFRGVSTLARGVYGYSVAFHLTGEERYLTYARAGLEWLEEHAFDEIRGGWYRDLTETGGPVDSEDQKQLFDLASLGMAYGMYFNVTRDPWAEAGLLGVRDLIFSQYHNPANNRYFDARTADMSRTVDIGGNGRDIVNVLVPGTALLLPNADLLTEPERRAQFRADLRRVTQALLGQHRNDTSPETWWFWGRTGRIGVHDSLQTDFGHTIKSHEMIHNANQVFADRPWDDLSADRELLLSKAWDASADRWHDDLVDFTSGAVELDSPWWVHAEADQTLAAVNLRQDFVHSEWLARSAQGWFDDFVDPDFPHETWQRPLRDGTFPQPGGDEKSGRGKNMYHVFEHALVMYLHGRAMEDASAELHYALPEEVALTAEAEPYWFDATTEHRVVGEPVGVLPGHRHVTVSLSGLDEVPEPLFPPPDDQQPPTTVATVTPAPNAAGWSAVPVTVSFAATDEVAGVREIRVMVRDLTGGSSDRAWISPGGELALPFDAEGDYAVTFGAVDRLGNTEGWQTRRVRVDLTGPAVTGLPDPSCRIWPPNGRMVQIADVVGHDALSGVAEVLADVTVDEPAAGDVEVDGGVVRVRATRDDEGDGRVYTVTGSVSDVAGNRSTALGSCLVPHDRRP